MKKIVIFMVCLILYSCAEIPKVDHLSPLVNPWIGRSADDLVVTYGSPSDVYALDSGDRMYVYFKYQIVPREKKSEERIPEKYYDTNGNPVLNDVRDLRRKSKKVKKDDTCKLLFKVAANNFIQSWTTDGEECTN